MDCYWLKNLNISYLIVELDFSAIVQLMLNSSTNALIEPLLTDYSNLFHVIPNRQIRCAFRQVNKCTDMHLLM